MATDKLTKLKEKRDVYNAKIRQAQNKLKSSERRNDTRRKVLAGATVLQWAGKDNDFSTQLMRELEKFLVRNDDRALFGLPPIETK